MELYNLFGAPVSSSMTDITFWHLCYPEGSGVGVVVLYFVLTSLKAQGLEGMALPYLPTIPRLMLINVNPTAHMKGQFECAQRRTPPPLDY